MKDKSISEALLEEAQTATIEDFILKDLYEEIELINDPRIKSFVRSTLLKADAFWISAATLDNITHPPDERIEGGMILHTQRVVRIAFMLTQTIEVSRLNVDMLLAAALLHDITKAVWKDESRTEIVHDPMHPYTINAYIAWCSSQDKALPEFGKSNVIDIPIEILNQILRLIRCSHGIFSPIPETIPTTALEKVLHMADLIATNLHFIIDGERTVENRWK